MKSALLMTSLMASVLAAGVWLFGWESREELRESMESRPTKIGRDLQERDPEGPQAVDLAAWCEKDAAAAVAWAMKQDDAKRDEVLAVIVVEAAATRPAEAVKWAEAIGNVKTRGEALGFAAAQLAVVDASAVFELLAREGVEPDLRVAVEKMALPALAESDPVRVADWLSEGKASAAVVPHAVVTTVQRWVQQDAPAAAEWVGSFEDDALFKAAVEPLVSLWAKQGDEKLGKWIEGLPAGAARDEACAAYAAALAVGEPEEAKAWAGKIKGEELAKATMKRIGGE